MNLNDQMAKMKELYNLVILDPETNVTCWLPQFKYSDNIFVFTKAAQVQVATTAIRLLAEMFVNTAPLEAVDVKQIQERREVTITKDEFKVLKFEELHVAQYERYLKSLTELNAKLKLSNFQADQ